MKKIVFFGFGAVGSVMVRCLFELSARESAQVRFVLVVRSVEEAQPYLFRAPQGMTDAVEFIEMKDFSLLFRDPSAYKEQLLDAAILVNTSIPDFNAAILKLATEIGAHYCDLASDMYNEQTLATLQFPQQQFNQELMSRDLFGLINVGISPGVSNFLIGEKLTQLQDFSGAVVRDIRLYLLENITSQQIVFSWSPKVAMDELEEKPRSIRDGALVTIEPFSESLAYEFPHAGAATEQYPIYQEEVLSLHQTYPMAASISVSSGGSEVELIKNLFQLNLLSKQSVGCIDAGMSVEAIVRMVLPGMKSPQKIEQLLQQGVIKSAQFAAMAEITLETKKTRESVLTTESTGLSFHRYAELLDTPYSGATYISYPTGVGAAVLLFYTYKLWQSDKTKLGGILRAEELPALLGAAMTDVVKRELSAYKIDFISHTHSLTKKNSEK
ncbi:MAG: hypothetical protein COV10_04315 [Candidatus Vogelbacteria bacterium CG10_big_fil_rev_8_21_14_0_10_51_16]|uniref:Saccharopine dehydrogenase NADP binding domain-containing protein n=1 Tax=Candidatus Vogelbacteria bacterium CG10_big_fil_rev_8_21_14_0_10_51_16 TaxID=1975045 RepID=A0A2H0RDA2_9BACT|nr:MAG: hypothetical protein COV10_04315 [Candidatus Vogelbacteria bacterium CG10_big_fil_rev_8_21_14_0_10_51_16]